MLSTSIIKNNEISITEEEWTALNNNLSQDEIIQLISDAMDEVPMPQRDITHKEAVTDFGALRDLDSSTLLKHGKTYSRYEYKYPLSDEYIDISKIGNKSSDYFHQDSRWRCDSLNSPSPYRMWTTEKFRKNMLKNLWSWDKPTTHLDSTRLRSALSLRGYIASQFRPSAAKALYDKYKPETVLDFSSGWGDRLAGFYAANNTRTYYGFDPNINLIDGYAEQQTTYQKLVSCKAAFMYNQPAEEAYFGGGYDLVFTSPPYFDTERYTQEDNQSWKRYKGVVKNADNTEGVPQKWLDNFLLPVVEEAWNGLNIDGILAINIADVYGHHVRTLMCDPMNNFISGLEGAEFQGGLGYRMAKRPNSAADKTGIFVEPIWVWKKLS